MNEMLLLSIPILASSDLLLFNGLVAGLDKIIGTLCRDVCLGLGATSDISLAESLEASVSASELGGEGGNASSDSNVADDLEDLADEVELLVFSLCFPVSHESQ